MLLPVGVRARYAPAFWGAAMTDDATLEIEFAELLREYGPFPGASQVHGVTFDGRYVWLAVGERMLAVAPEIGEIARTLELPAQAGSAFDGRHLYQIAGDLIQKIDHQTGEVV